MSIFQSKKWLWLILKPALRGNNKISDTKRNQEGGGGEERVFKDLSYEWGRYLYFILELLTGRKHWRLTP